MATKPTTVPRWARTAAGADATNITVPSSGEEDTGFTNGQNVVSSGKVNWIFNWLTKWIFYLQDAVFTATAGSGLPGVSGTGDGAQPGVSGTGGGTSGPGVKGTGGATDGDGLAGTGLGAGSGARGIGGPTGPGVTAQAGGGASPARAALALVSQNTPSLLTFGDLWWDGSANAPRVVGGAGGNSWLSKYLFFSGLPGAAASTTYFLAAASNSTAAAATVSALGATQYIAPARRAISFGVKTSTTTVGGTITVQLWVGGAQVGTSLTLAAGTVAGFYQSATINAEIVPGAIIELRVVNGTGVTTGVGQCVGFVEVL